MSAEPTTGERVPRAPTGAEMTILEHLFELRNRAMVAAIAVIIGLIVCFIFWEDILGWMLAPARDHPDVGDEFQVYNFGVAETLMTAFKIALYGGFTLASPVVFYEVLAFVLPAMTPSERRILFGGIVPLIAFLLAGMAFAYWVVLPASLGFLIGFGGDDIGDLIGIQEYTNFVLRIVVLTGLAFELPVVMAMIARIGLVTWRQYLKFWRYAIVLIAAATAVLTPTPDYVTFGYVGLPLLALYFVGVLLAMVVGRRRGPTAAVE